MNFGENANNFGGSFESAFDEYENNGSEQEDHELNENKADQSEYESMSEEFDSEYLSDKKPDPDYPGNKKQVDIYSLEVIGSYLGRNTFLKLMEVDSRVVGMLDNVFQNGPTEKGAHFDFEFESAEDIELFPNLEIYHTSMDYDKLIILSEIISGKDKPRLSKIVMDIPDKETGYRIDLPDQITEFDWIIKKIAEDTGNPDLVKKINDKIDYNRSKFTVTIKDLESFDFDKNPYIERAHILLHTCLYYDRNEIDLRMYTNLTELGSYKSTCSFDPRGTFAEYSYLRKIQLPSSIKVIGDGCFDKCSSLEEIEIPYGVEYIGSNCFYRCKFTSIVIPNSVTYIGNSCFSDQTSLVNITLSTNLEYLGSFCFCECSNLHTINIPSSLNRINPGTFCDCGQLVMLDIPDGIKWIDENAFEFCTALTSINLPVGLKELGNRCFSECINLRVINLPNTLQKLGKECFNYCTQLMNIQVPNSVTYLGENATDTQTRRGFITPFNKEPAFIFI